MRAYDATYDEIAALADVSRKTVCNAFGGKVAATRSTRVALARAALYLRAANGCAKTALAQQAADAQRKRREYGFTPEPRGAQRNRRAAALRYNVSALTPAEFEQRTGLSWRIRQALVVARFDELSDATLSALEAKLAVSA